MSPAASRQTTARATPEADRAPGAPPSPGSPTGCVDEADSPRIANATSRTTDTAAAAATTPIVPNVPQSMCTAGPLPGQTVMSTAAGRGRSLTLAAVTASRRDAA